jgi:TolB-like protein/Flp pilus assembly protein TadD
MPEARQSGSESVLSAAQVQLVRRELDLILSSEAFAGSRRCQEFLHLIVEHALAGEIDSLRERMIGVEMFGRRVDYDTSNDAVVRVRATEVRRRLGQYYAELGKPPAVRIEIPSGSYVPKFSWQQPEIPPESPPGPVNVTARATAPAIAPVTTPETIPPPEPGWQHPQAPTTRSPRNLRLLAGGIASLIALAAIAYFTIRRFFPSHGGIQSIVVLPLANLSGDPAQGYFADGMTGELTTDLGQVSALRVISETSAMTYKGTKKMLPEIARELRVDAVVEGSVEREGDQARITAQLIDAKTDRHIWARSYTRHLSSMLALQGEVAKEIADAIRIELTPQEKAHLGRTGTVNLEAQDLYLLGAHVLDVGDPQHALGYFQKAVERDPDFAQAYAALSRAYFSLGQNGVMAYAEAFPKAKATALKAIELDEALADGHLALADVVADLDWDWVTQERQLKRALELNPSSASVHWAYAFALEKLGRIDEALVQLRIMRQFDPVSSQSTADAVDAYYYARRYDIALDELRRLDAANPQHITVDFWYGVIYREKGLYDQSVKAFMKWGDNPHALGHMGNALARAGRVTEARATIPKLQEHIQRDGIGAYEVALVYAGLGEKDQAFAWLEKAYAVRNKGLTFLKIDPCLDPLRSDPRFQDLLRRVGLPL